MKVFIDNQQVETDHRTQASITLSVATQRQLDTSHTGYSKTLVLPATALNHRLLGMPHDVSAARRFNAGAHTARIEKEGCTVLEGVPMLTESVGSYDGYFRLNIVGAGLEWVRRAAQTMLRELPIDFDTTLTAQTIAASWRGKQAVRMLPVQRPGFAPRNLSANIVPPQRVLTTDDYHPFLHVATLLKAIFALSDYTLKSNFVESELFQSLHISGNYPGHNASNDRQAVDFLAARLTSASATPDRFGRVYATPYDLVNGVGNIVDTVDPTRNVGGVVAANAFSNGGYFRMNAAGHVEFQPPRAMTVAFECNIIYNTSYRFDTTTGRMAGFDRVWLGAGGEHRFDLRLPWPDKKNRLLQPLMSFNLMSYDYTAGDRHRMEVFQLSNPNADLNDLKPGNGSKTMVTLNEPSAVTCFETGEVPWVVQRLLRMRAGESAYTEVPVEKWAVYDTSMPMSGTMDVEVVLRTPAMTVTPGTAVTFHDIYFGGAEAGMILSLPHGTTLRPIFTSGPAEGDTLSFANVAAHDSVTCLEFVQALRQMFNLHFHTDRTARVVLMEPRDEFLRGEPVVDLTGRIDLSKPVSVSDLGAEASRTMTFCYGQADAAVGEFNRISTSGDLGVWSFEVKSALAAEGEKRFVNPLFAPSASETGAYSRAVAASLLRVGSTDSDPNFAMKIVRYGGMRALPAGQTWGWPGEAAEYPLLAFFEPSAGLSLAFEDRGGVTGLHTCWDSSLALCDSGRRLTAWVDLHPHEVEALVQPNDLGRDFRALYRITLGGESALWRLEEVTDYDPAANRTTKCTFVK